MESLFLVNEVGSDTVLLNNGHIGGKIIIKTRYSRTDIRKYTDFNFKRGKEFLDIISYL